MGDIRESTGEFMRKVKPLVEQTVKLSVKEHLEETRIMQKETNGLIKELKVFQSVMKETIIGKLPPDPNKPSMWQSLQEMILWRKGVNKVLWIACTSSIGALVAVVWKIIMSSVAVK